MLVGNVGVDLGSSYTTVAKHGLDASNIRSVHEEVGGKAVAHGVRTNMLGNTSEPGVLINDSLDTP